jgi:ribokinase
MPKSSRIAVIGSVNIDLTTFTDRFPKSGETILGQKFDLGFGGKGANQAVAARLCGAEVFMVARVGKDLFGQAAVENLSSIGIDVSHTLLVDGVSTGVAPIFVDPEGHNRIIVVKGANECVTPAVVEAAAPILQTVDCIVLQFEIPLETVFYAVNFARKHHVRCIVNPAPAQTFDLKRLAGTDYFVPNESEAEAISGVPVQNVDDAKLCAAHLLSGGIQRVIITLGANGSLVGTHEVTEHIPAYLMQAVDSSGAGDAFIGSFAAFLGDGIPEREAVHRANLYAGLSTTAVGTQKSFRTRVQFDAEWSARQ